jgi:hypothetical protein
VPSDIISFQTGDKNITDYCESFHHPQRHFILYAQNPAIIVFVVFDHVVCSTPDILDDTAPERL